MTKLRKEITLLKINENFNFFENMKRKMQDDAAICITYHFRRYVKKLKAGRPKAEVKKD